MNQTTAFPRRAGAPLAEPITLAQALYHVKKESDGGQLDASILMMITAAREACEDRTERTMISTPMTLTLDGFPRAIELRSPPIMSVQSVKFVDADGALQTLSPLDYVLDNASEPGYIVPAPGKEWPSTQTGAINTVRVAYTAGYGDTAASVPAPLKSWMLLAIGSMDAIHNSSSDRPTVEHGFSENLLNPYRMMGI